MIRIQKAIPLEGFKVRLTLTNGQIIDRDLAPLLAGPVFESLRGNPELFASFQIKRGTLTWPGNVDLCPDSIIGQN